MSKPKLIVIDLDGTLVDSVPDLAFCIDAMMAKLNLPPRGEAAVRNWVGNGIEKLVKRALLGQLDGEPDEVLFKQAYAVFLSLYAAHNGERSRLYPAVKQGLDYLHAAGYTLVCVTNKAGQFTGPLLSALGIRDHFALVISGDTLPQKKPHPAPLLHAAQSMEMDPREALMLGDSVNDVQAARAAGFRIICVSYGYNHGEDIRDAKPDAVIDSFAELAQLL
ncbi:MAG: phosphoglycolate phosphatase [Gammaproteobacteria bacterium]|nr:phosphoglycolate phosphatase [Gammaproteobacteria bacterium]